VQTIHEATHHLTAPTFDHFHFLFMFEIVALNLNQIFELSSSRTLNRQFRGLALFLEMSIYEALEFSISQTLTLSSTDEH
jgi:hypothetical protein